MTGISRQTLKTVIKFGLIMVSCWAAAAYAENEPQTIGSIAANITSSVANLARLVTAASYVAGMAFAVGAVMKFKAHRDNPTQIPVGTPIALMFISAALIFLPNVFIAAGGTLFGKSRYVGGPSGAATFGATSATELGD